MAGSQPHSSSDNGDVTELLQRVSSGEVGAADLLFPMVYGELRAIAAAFLRNERPDHTLQPTALVNEAFVRLVDQTRAIYSNKHHFMAVAAKAMRRILVDHARAHKAEKRGAGAVQIAWSDVIHITDLLTLEDHSRLLDLDDALTRLQSHDERAAHVVTLIFFGQLTRPECAAALGISLSSVNRDYEYAQLWLLRALRST